MLVVCCGMGRSGGTQQYQLTMEIFKRYELGEIREFGLHYAKGEDALVKSEWFSEKYERYVVPVLEGKGKAIGIYRDPRDVITSLLEWRGRQEKEYKFEDGLWHRIFDRWNGWEPICSHVARYEDVHPDNWAKEVAEIGQVLGVKIDDKEAHNIAATWSIDNNIDRQAEQTSWFHGPTMLTKKHISRDRGRSRWRERLTTEQVYEIEEYLGKDWMEAHGYSLLDSTR